MTMTTTQMELASRVVQDLSREFFATVWRSGPTGSLSVTCGAGPAENGDDILTPFHLDPRMEGECAGIDWYAIFILMSVIHAISWLPRYFVYEPLANARMQGFKTWDNEEAKKFSQTATSLLFFCSSAFFVYRVLSTKEWLYSREGWKEMTDVELVSPDFKFYHLLYLARFFSDMISIFFESRKLEAFVASFIHHIVTIGLVLGSAHIGHVGYGGIIMFFFDWADIPLLSAKLFKYLSKDPNDIFQFVANRLFEVFAVCFFFTRNLFFNFVVYAVFQGLKVNPVNRFVEFLLVMLIILQTYWMWLIIKAVQRQKASGGNIDDVREKEE